MKALQRKTHGRAGEDAYFIADDLTKKKKNEKKGGRKRKKKKKNGISSHDDDGGFGFFVMVWVWFSMSENVPLSPSDHVSP